MMTRKTIYEWDIETMEDDGSGDILDHHHEDRLRDLPALESNQRLALVRDVWDEHDGLIDRLWAYVDYESKMLPKYFEDCGQPTMQKIPQKFHREIAAQVSRAGI